jgi:hypothetical protein
MKTKLMRYLIPFILGLMISVIPSVRTTYAQCGCSCAMVCNNTCEVECSGCGLMEGVNAAIRCCQEARDATGSTGPCHPESS